LRNEGSFFCSQQSESLKKKKNPQKAKHRTVRGQWFTLVILGTQEAEIRRITVRSQPRQIVSETFS
jgi:hypothetical protein